MFFGKAFLLFLIPTLVSAQEITNRKPASEWLPCERFGIKDKSVLDHPEKIHYLILRNYRQKTLQLSDPIGDYALTLGPSSNLQSAFRESLGLKKKEIDLEERASAKLCAKVLFDLEDEAPYEIGKHPKDVYQASSQYVQDKKMLEELLKDQSDSEKLRVLAFFENGEIVVESKKTPLNPNALSGELIKVIEEEEKKGIVLSRGEAHVWSQEFIKQRKTLSMQMMRSIPTKILAALSIGKTVDLLVTEKEKDLLAFILSQETSSLTVPEIFRKSFQLNHGNLYLTLLTIENVLADGWLHPRRSEFKRTENLKPFARVFGSQGDVFGHWYHLFGMMYFGYVKGSFHAAVAGKVEAIGSSVVSKFKGERQENRINMAGGRIGDNLRKYVKAREENKEFKLEIDETVEKDDLEKLVKKKVKKILKGKGKGK